MDKYTNKIKEFQDKGSQIVYVSRRFTRQEIRDLYSSSHVGLNLLRMTSWGFPLHEMPACGTLVVTGDFSPTNILVNKNYDRALVLGETGGFDLLIPGHLWTPDLKTETKLKKERRNLSLEKLT